MKAKLKRGMSARVSVLHAAVFSVAMGFGAVAHADVVAAAAIVPFAAPAEFSSTEALAGVAVPPAGKVRDQWLQGRMEGASPFAEVTTRFPNGADGASMEIDGTGKVWVSYYPTTDFGTLDELTAVSYDWWKESGTGTGPVMRLLLRDVSGNYAGMIMYNPAVHAAAGAAAPNTWNTANLLTGSVMYIAPGPDTGVQLTQPLATLAGLTNVTWNTYAGTHDLSSFTVYGIQIGLGSGFTNFNGAVDNVVVSSEKASVSASFAMEAPPPVVTPTATAAVPAMSVLGLLGLSGVLGGFGVLRQRRRKA